MAKIAIDVVLLPSEEMMNKAIEINKELLKNNEDKIILDKEKCLPHISLCMGCIEEDKIPEIKNILDEGNEKGVFEIADTGLVAEAIVLATKGFELPIFMGRSDYDHNRLINPLIELLYQGIKKRKESSESKAAQE